jgi:hypothetical protein
MPKLCLILIVGGLLIKMGQHDRSEALFFYLLDAASFKLSFHWAGFCDRQPRYIFE